MTKKQPIPFGKYLLLDRVNIGGMAEVWKAKTFGAEGFEKLVAIKRILPNIAEDEEFIAMFIDEAKISVQLTHANIAQVFDLGKIGDSYYIAMEYVSGKDLRAIFDKARKRGEPAPIPLTCYCLSKAAEGLDYAHRKRDAQGNDLNIVHRDVSPQNILCSFDGETKVIDFGIAKAANKATKTQAGILKGKFGYMSPEQVRGLPLDRRSDVFALGVVLYEMLTGERLFVGESDFSVLEKVRAVDILPPSNYNRRIPAPLEKIVLRALAKDVEDRFQYASELGDELQRFLITNDTIFSRKDLMQYMKSSFAEDVEREKLKIAEYADVKLPPGIAALANAPQVGGAPLPPRTSGTNIPAVAPPQSVRAADPDPAVDLLSDSPTNAGQIPGPPVAPVRTATGSSPRVSGSRPAIPPPAMGRPPAMSGSRPAPPLAPGRAVTGAAPRLSTNSGMPVARTPQASNPRGPPVAPAANFASDIGAALDDELDDATVAQGSRGQAAPSTAQDLGAVKRSSKLPLILGIVGVVAVLGIGGVLAINSGLMHSTGTLLLNCSPSDNLIILIDGQPAGSSTPLMNAKMAVGDHALSITAKGYDIERRHFAIEKQQTHIEDIELKKHGEPSEAAKQVAAAIVRATAGAEITVDGKVVIAKDAADSTYLGELDGSVAHVVEAKLDGYQPFSKSFPAGEPVRVTAALQKSP